MRGSLVKSNMRKSSPRWDMQVGLIVVFFLCGYNLISNDTIR